MYHIIDFLSIVCYNYFKKYYKSITKNIKDVTFMCAYYDGTKLLSLTDLDGKQPEILMVTTNRTGGKTTYFGRLCVNKFKKGQGKFALLYRYNYELDDCADKFFKDLSTLFFQGSIMESKRKASDSTYKEIKFISTRFNANVFL